MRRRSFTKALASLLVVPLLKFQPEHIDRHKLLSMFLEETECTFRYDLTRPYIFGDYSYGTDGRVMARIDTDETEHDDDTIRMPPIEQVWNLNFQPSQIWKPFKLAEYGELVCASQSKQYGGSCPKCDDRRVSFGADYPTDQATADELPEYDPDDNTIRDRSCFLCRGKPYYAGSNQRVGSQLIAYRYAKKLAAIPGCEISFSGFQNVVLFRSDAGISGIVMPIEDR